MTPSSEENWLTPNSDESNPDQADTIESTTRENEAPQREEISSELSPGNILPERRWGHQTPKLNPNYMSYTAYKSNGSIFDLLIRAVQNGDEFLCVHQNDLPPPPKDFKDMQNHPLRDCFWPAMQFKYDSIEKLGTWKLVLTPEHTKTGWTGLLSFR